MLIDHSCRFNFAQTNIHFMRNRLLEKKWKYHKASYDVVEVKKYDDIRRPKSNAIPNKIVYKINGTA
jgi:hypothetical protein